MLFAVTINWTDQGIRGIKEAPKRAQAARGPRLSISSSLQSFRNNQAQYICVRSFDLSCCASMARGEQLS